MPKVRAMNAAALRREVARLENDSSRRYRAWKHAEGLPRAEQNELWRLYDETCKELKAKSAELKAAEAAEIERRRSGGSAG